jgi:predicted metal-dependent phosphoesterase TrpH
MKKFDFHIHSTLSKHNIWGIDGIHGPEKIVEMAVRIGLDGIAVTDHNCVKGSQKAIQYVAEKNLSLLVIPGAEIRSSEGDILALGIQEDIKPKLSIFDTVDQIKAQGGIAIAAHPYKYNTKLGVRMLDPAVSSRFDAIEVFNSCVRKGANEKALQLAEKLKMVGVAGSDAHSVENIGRCVTGLEINDMSVEAVFHAIKQNKIELTCYYATLGVLTKLYFRKFINMLKRPFNKGEQS